MDSIRAKFVFDGNQYDVAKISATGLQVECADGFAEEIIRKFRGGGFAFVLRDAATANEIELIGELDRCEYSAQGGQVVRIWITKNEQNWSRSARPDADSGTGKINEYRPVLDMRRAKAGQTIAVGGGKGGVGKTIVSVNLALMLSRLSKSVTLLDGDAGNCNCNTLLGITRVASTLEEYLHKERALEEITVSTAYKGLRLVCGAQNKVDASLSAEMSRLLTDIGQVDADCIVIDLGAGMSDETLDLYRFADEKIIVVTPQVTALQNAYSFIKSAFFHDLKRSGGFSALLDRAGSDPQKLRILIDDLEEGHLARQAFAIVLARQRFRIVGNMVNGDQDMKIVQNLQKVVGQYLHIDNTILGTMASSDDIRNSVNRITPFVALSPDLPQSREMKQMALKLTQKAVGKPI